MPLRVSVFYFFAILGQRLVDILARAEPSRVHGNPFLINTVCAAAPRRLSSGNLIKMRSKMRPQTSRAERSRAEQHLVFVQLSGQSEL